MIELEKREEWKKLEKIDDDRKRKRMEKIEKTKR